MSCKDFLRHAVRGALVLGSAGSLAGAVTALALQAPAAGTAATAGANLSKIVVTGSRIPQTAVATAQPVLRINRQQIEATGFQTVSQLLQNLPAAGPSINAKFTETNNGEETINLHDLGSNRVLVLVNGQRWISQLNNVVDLTTIPLSVVDHIEILLDGASSIYGSEAIAGVINIITVKNYNGAEADAYLGEYDANGDGGGWDGRTQQYSFTVGTSSRRSAVLLSAGYYEQNPVFARDRTISKEPVIDRGVQNGFPSAGGRFVVLNLTGTSQLPNGCSPSGFICDISGPNSNDPSGFHANTADDNYNYRRGETMLMPSERWYAYSQGHYDLTDNLTFHFMTTYRHRNSVRYLFPFPMLFGSLGSAEQNGMKIGVAKDAPGNPFGVDLVPYFPGTSQFGEWCQRFGSPTCTSRFDVALFVGGAPVGLGLLTEGAQWNTFYFNGGFDGFFNLGGNQWHWNADYVYSQSLNTGITTGLRNTARFQEALSENCAVNANCTPINIFGSNNITPAAKNYVDFVSKRVTQKVLRDYNTSVNGSFFDHWYAGPWGVAAGYEYEETDGFDQPDAEEVVGNTSVGAEKPTFGRKSTNAQFAELSVPLAKDAFLAKDITVDFAQRYSQFHWAGIGNVFDPQTSSVTTGTVEKFAHAATPRVTMKWAPIQDLLFRGTWAQGFRTPSLSELFEGTTSGNFGSIVDPCAQNPNTTPRSSLPPGCNGHFHVQPTSNLVQVTNGGNSQLDPEKAITRTLGFVISPHQLPNFNFSADFYKTEVINVIRTPGAQSFVNECFIDQNPASCSHIRLSGSGDNTAIADVISLEENAGSQRVEGWDLNFRYLFPTTSVGEFAAALSANFTRMDVICLANGICQDISGMAGPTDTGAGSDVNSNVQPEHQYHFTLNWNYGPWGAAYNMTIIGPVWEDCALSAANGEGRTATETAAGMFDNGFCSKIIALDSNGSIKTGSNHLGTTVYQDIQMSYTVAAWNTTFTFGVQNIADKQPPIGENGAFNFYPSPYRLPGRFFYGRVRVTF